VNRKWWAVLAIISPWPLAFIALYVYLNLDRRKKEADDDEAEAVRSSD